MATKPKQVTLTNSSVEILNYIRQGATTNYKEFVPYATPDADSIRAIGNVIMSNPQLQNEYLNALVNRIAFVKVTSKGYDNPWSMFKKGLLEFGETVEEIFVEMAKPFQYSPDVAERELFKREIPDVRSAFHVLNFKKFYKTTVQSQDLRSAFTSWGAQSDLITRIIEQLYVGSEYDEYQVMKYMVARNIIDGKMKLTTIPTVEESNMKKIVSTVKAVSNDLTFKKRDYNLAGVRNQTEKNDQYLIINTKFDAEMDVEVLASAFNIDRAQFSGRRVLVDGFGDLDNERLAILFDGDTNYIALTPEERQAVNQIPLILVDRDWFMIYDNLLEFTEEVNAQGLYWNYFYHTWKLFSVSPFANQTMFVSGTPSVTSVTVSPSTATMSKGGKIYFMASVITGDFAPQTINWSINSTKSTITNSGVLQIGADEDASTITVTATSVFDGTKKGTAVVTLA